MGINTGASVSGGVGGVIGIGGCGTNMSIGIGIGIGIDMDIGGVLKNGFGILNFAEAPN